MKEHGRCRGGLALCLHIDISCHPHACPYGFFSDPTRECRCTGAIIQRYLSKISGPLLDRIDLHVEVPAVPYKELRGKDQGTGSAEMRQRMEAARSIQQRRGFYNARIPSPQLRKGARWTKPASAGSKWPSAAWD